MDATTDATARVQTRRTVLMPMVNGDADDVVALHRDPRVIRHVLDGIPDDLRKFAIYLAWANGLRAAGQGVWTARHRDGGVFLGLFTLTPCEGRGDCLEFGGRLCRAGWHGDLAVEIAAALIEHGFATLGTARLISVFHPDNRTAPVALARLGFGHSRATTMFGTAATEVSLGALEWRADDLRQRRDQTTWKRRESH